MARTRNHRCGRRCRQRYHSNRSRRRRGGRVLTDKERAVISGQHQDTYAEGQFDTAFREIEENNKRIQNYVPPGRLSADLLSNFQGGDASPELAKLQNMISKQGYVPQNIGDPRELRARERADVLGATGNVSVAERMKAFNNKGGRKSRRRRKSRKSKRRRRKTHRRRK